MEAISTDLVFACGKPVKYQSKIERAFAHQMAARQINLFMILAQNSSPESRLHLKFLPFLRVHPLFASKSV